MLRSTHVGLVCQNVTLWWWSMGFGFFTLLRSVQNDRGGIDPRVKHGNDGGNAVRGERGIPRSAGDAGMPVLNYGVVVP